MFNPLDFTGKKILVTGASSGIGRQIAIYLSKLGASLVLNGRNDEELRKTESLLEKNTSSILISGDLTNDKTIEDLFNKNLYEEKKLDGFVYCSGVVPTIPLRGMSKEKIKNVFDINVFSFFECIKFYCRNGISNGGSIVGISSIASVQPEKCQSLYSATKAAMNAMVQSLAIELSEKNTRINTVMPGVTKVIDKFSEEVEELSKKQLFGSLDPNEISAQVAYLLSDMAKTITGRAFYCDAGRLL